MSYIELANEYLRQYKFLSTYVKQLKDEFNLVYTKLNFKEKTQFQRRIYLIYSMCLELKHDGEYLKKCERRSNNCQNKNYS